MAKNFNSSSKKVSRKQISTWEDNQRQYLLGKRKLKSLYKAAGPGGRGRRTDGWPRGV
jgi:hypothetical protein